MFPWLYSMMMSLVGFAIGLWVSFAYCRPKIQNLERINESIRQKSLIDDLTGASNRGHLFTQMNTEMERANRYGHPLAVFMIDIDNFKQINDNLGHLAGDAVLRETVALLKRSIRKVDVLGRYGGDEFMVLLPETTPEAGQRVALRLQKKVREYRYSTSLGPMVITISIGMFSLRGDQKVDQETFIEMADQCLRRAKAAGKDQFASVRLVA